MMRGMGDLMSGYIDQHTHLWNDLPYEERKRLMPHMIESQRRHILQCRKKAVDAHKKHMKSLDELVKNLDNELSKLG